MKAPGVLLVVLGLLLGPGYYLYCERLTGHDMASFDLGPRADRWTLADGSIQRFRSGLAYRPQPLELDPERNRVRLTLGFAPATEGTAASINEYQATLFDGEHPLLQATLRVELRSDAPATVIAGTVAVHTPAEHLFVLEELGSPAVVPGRVMLTVRESVERAMMPLVWAGIALLLVGFGLFAYGLIAPRL